MMAGRHRQAGSMTLMATMIIVALMVVVASAASSAIRIKDARHVSDIEGFAVEILNGVDHYYQTKCTLGTVPLVLLDGDYVLTPIPLFTTAYVSHWNIVIHRPASGTSATVTADIATEYMVERLTDHLLPGITVVKLSDTKVQWRKGIALQTKTQTRNNVVQRQLGEKPGCI